MKIGYTHIFKFSTTQYPVVKSTDSGGGIAYVLSLQQGVAEAYQTVVLFKGVCRMYSQMPCSNC
jgi:hypothetical protein